MTAAFREGRPGNGAGGDGAPKHNAAGRQPYVQSTGEAQTWEVESNQIVDLDG